MIYFDNAATTYPKPECVYEASSFALQNYAFNAGRGSYKSSRETFKMIEKTREKIGSFVGISKDKIVFTSSATESLNIIIYGLNLHEDDTVFVSPFEHNAIVRTLKNIGVKIEIIPFDKVTWNVNEKELNDLYLIKKPKATFLSHISNVTGFMLPYETIFSIAKKYNSITVLDCAQSFGIYNINIEKSDFIVFAGHKSLYSIFGIAGFLAVTDVELKKYKVGGTGSDSLNPEMPDFIPSKYEAGSMNSIGIYTINKSLEYLMQKNYSLIEDELTAYLLKELRKINKIIIYLPKLYYSHGIVSFNVSGFTADEIGEILSEEYDICVRTGYHCAPFVHDFISSKPFNGTIRVSVGIFNTRDEIDKLIESIKEIAL